MANERDDTLPVQADGSLDFSDIATLLAERVEYLETEDLDTHAPTLGRVAKELSSREFYVGDGSEWNSADEFISGSFGSINTERVSTKKKPVYDVTAWGAKGDGSTDDRQAIQDAIDEANSDGGGIVFLPSGTYNVDVGGQDSDDGTNYCLEGRSNVTLRGVGKSSFIQSTAEKATLLWLNNTSDFVVEKVGMDANYHVDPQPTDETQEAMGIKVGARRDSSSTCYDTRISNIYLSGAFRHGIDTSAGSTRGIIENCIFDDASGDDDVSISIDSTYWTVRDCWSINKKREGTWDAASFEAEDGASHVLFEGLYSINSEYDAFCIGKSHPPDNPSSHHTIRDCWAITPSANGIVIPAQGDGQTTKSIIVKDCRIIGPGEWGITCTSGSSGHVMEDVTIDGVEIEDSGASGMRFYGGGTHKNLNIRNVKITNAGDFGISLNDSESSTVHDSFTIGNSTIDASKYAIRFLGDDTFYANDSVVKNCDISSGWSPAVDFEDASIRSHVRLLKNGIDTDFSSIVPTSVNIGDEYYDDGTNTGSGMKGKRVYDGSSWIDVWTA